MSPRKRRRVVDVANAGAVLLALGLSSFGVWVSTPRAGSAARALPSPDPLAQSPRLMPDGSRVLIDATGAAVPLGHYRRIVSGSSLADPLLLALCSPEQIVAFSARAPRARDAYRYAGKPAVDALRQPERLLELAPDLVLVNSLGEHAWVERLRASGLVVFDLGPMRGTQTFIQNVHAVGWLSERHEGAAELAQTFQRRLDAIARQLAPADRRSAIYLGIHGRQLFGGTRGSSYHEVLTFAGLDDVAARDFQGWPNYEPERLLSLNPELVVTQTGMRAALCDGELGALRACGPSGGVIEVDADLLSDAGLGLLDAAERVHRAAYPERR